jgi:SNF2 family DNA or RNA helicase
MKHTIGDLIILEAFVRYVESWIKSMPLRSFQATTLNAALGQRAFMNLDEQGTGKTWTQCSEFAETGAIRNLIACPVVAMGVWEYHLKLLCPDVEVLRWPDVGSHATTLITLGSTFPNHKVVGECWCGKEHVKGKKKVTIADEYLRTNNWDFVVIDEAQGLRNRNSAQTRAIKQVKNYEFIRLLSGTLMDNRPDELWSPLNVAWPKEFSSYWKYFHDFVEYDEDYFEQKGYYKITGPKNTLELRRILYGGPRPKAVRHLKKDVMPELPDKYYTYIPLDMSNKQARAYNEMRKEALAWIGNGPDLEPLPAPILISKMTRLSLFASAYAEFEGENVRASEPSNKLDALMELLDTMNFPIVVFSSSTQLLHMAARRLAKNKISFRLIEGRIPANYRTKYVQEFQDGDVDVMLCQTRSGGVAITLTRATTAIFLDRDWAPGANEQAEDRLHRIGQDNAVQIIILQSKNTIDKYRERKLEIKRKWIREILN